jgi:hypothetical protein
MVAVSDADWRICGSVSAERRYRLLKGAPSSASLIAVFGKAATCQAEDGSLKISWHEASEARGHFRVEATVFVTSEQFDWIFNGSTGYRAAYWVSVEEGQCFNRQLLQSIEPAFRIAWLGCARQVSWKHARLSLLGKHSKLWAPERKISAPNECEDWGDYGLLIPDRWKGDSYNEGTRLPMPCRPRLEVKGTFINSEGHDWLHPNKAQRHDQIHETGFT